MRRPMIVGIASLALAFGMWTGFRDARVAIAQPPGTPRPGGPPRGMRPPGDRPMMPAATDSFAAERDSIAKAVLADIAGKENMPAESVFKNIKIFKKMPAGRLVNVMNMGFGRALGA